MGLDPGRSRPDWMIISVLPVTPPCVRPNIALDAVTRSEDDLTHQYTQIIKTNAMLRKQIERGGPKHIIDELV